MDVRSFTLRCSIPTLPRVARSPSRCLLYSGLWCRADRTASAFPAFVACFLIYFFVLRRVFLRWTEGPPVQQLTPAVLEPVAALPVSPMFRLIPCYFLSCLVFFKRYCLPPPKQTPPQAFFARASAALGAILVHGIGPESAPETITIPLGLTGLCRITSPTRWLKFAYARFLSTPSGLG